MPSFLDAFGEAYERRQKFSKLAAMFFTEIGPLNEVIHIWPYADTAERDKVRAEAVKAGVWPPKVTRLLYPSPSPRHSRASRTPSSP